MTPRHEKMMMKIKSKKKKEKKCRKRTQDDEVGRAGADVLEEHADRDMRSHGD